MNSESTPPKPLKVFISYSHDSEERLEQVLELSDRLRKDGIDCNIDRYELSPPQGWQAWAEEQVENADCVLMVLTKQYKRRFLAAGQEGISRVAPWEGAIITPKQYDRLARKIVIITYGEDVDLPDMLAQAPRYNILNNDFKGLYERLARVELGKRDELPRREPIQSFITSKNKTSIQAENRCNLPSKTYGKFFGRREEINHLLSKISPDYRQHISVIMGIGGVGKTALALEVAYRCLEAKKSKNKDINIPIFDAIIFTSSKATDLVNTKLLERPEKETLLTDMFRVIAEVLNEQTITQVLPEEQTRKVYEILRKQTTLLIVDNMETLAEEERRKMLSFLNNVPTTTQVIITTRDFLGFDDISIQSLTEQDGFDLLDRQAKLKQIELGEDWADWRRKIYNRFGGIPTALIYAMGQKAAGYEFADIVNSGVTEITADLCRFCFDSSVASLKGTAAYQLLQAMTFFEDSACRDAMIRVAGLTEGDRTAIEAVAKLQQLSLIIENSGRYSMLALTREYASLELNKEENARFRAAVREDWYEWYLEFTNQYGGNDWEGWRAKYRRLDAEWKNIEAVLNWYAGREEWEKVLQIWQNVDNYADLAGYWQYRRYWWALLGRNYGSVETRVKAFSEKGFTLTLMGIEHLETAESYLSEAWNLCQDGDSFLQATVANHRAVLAKVQGDYGEAHRWLNIELGLLETEQTGLQKSKKRYLARNMFYTMEIYYLKNELEVAKNGLERVLDLTREIGWQRFKNYAKNILAEIYIRLDNLASAEQLLKSGFETAKQVGEIRRIALYQASYARFYFQSALKARENGLNGESIEHLNNARKYATDALETFTKELMIAEKNEITSLIESIDRSISTSQSPERTEDCDLDLYSTNSQS
jgi:hypothetical protein